MMSENNNSRKSGKSKERDATEEKHCLCDSRDYTTLMIACDYCSIWYHAKCMGLSKVDVDRIKKYACNPCGKKGKTTIYKKQYKKKELPAIKGREKRKQATTTSKSETEEAVEESVADKKESSGEPSAKRKRKKSTNDTNLDEKEEIDQKQSPAAMDNIKTEICDASYPNTTEISNKFSPQSSPVPLPVGYQLQEEYPQLRCNDNCIGCYRDSDCGKCAICVQHNNKLCVQRVCVKIEELFRQMHDAANIKKEPIDDGGGEEGEQKEGTGQLKKKGRKPKHFQGGIIKQEPQNEMAGEQRKRRNAQNIGNNREISVAAQLQKVYSNWLRNRKKHQRGSTTQSTTESMMSSQLNEVQCIGSGCVKTVRPGSRYCSEECGFALAQLRLKTILPQRVNDYFGQVPTSQAADSERMQQIEGQISEIQQQLKNLEQWKENVHTFLEALQNSQPSGEKARKEDEGLVFGCSVCGGDFPMREISKHVQSCYVRSEKQTTYGTDYAMPNNFHKLYCDAYNKINKTYCKRLRYSCAEHYKDEYELKICGCPLNWFKSAFSLTFQQLFPKPEAMMEGGGYCQEKRKSCRDHVNWIQTAFSLIDNERMNLMNRLEEMVEQQQLILKSLWTRGDVLTLLTSGPI